MKSLQIGGCTYSTPVILAPMAGVCDLPFRLLVRRKGAGLICMEMVSAKAIHFNNKNTKDLLAIEPEEVPVSLQLFGHEPEIMAETAARIEELSNDIVDINMGCPVPKIVNNGEGSALMKDPVLAGKIIEATVKATTKPVTVKIRKGFNDASVNAPELAHVAQESGAAAVAVHGRTREQYYAGTADWDVIRLVKEAVSIPVIGNGDVTDGPSAKRMMDETGCDGVMIGRAAQGNPWIIAKITEYLKACDDPSFSGKEEVKNTPSLTGQGVSMEEWKATVLEHMALMEAFKGEYIAVREMRKHICWYTAGMKGASGLRKKVNETEKMQELRDMVNAL
ncbi:MAG: tRNA dihydrouridine synthase DusB [Lachnospiraceae bacterium]|nr:tRNA dihydrouridine synthase DusB [Lachnospiraceae bacterium]